jgi:hypothetical protein
MSGVCALESDAKHWQQSLQDSGETDQNDKELQQVCQPPIARVLIDDPEYDSADDDDDEDVNQD